MKHFKHYLLTLVAVLALFTARADGDVTFEINTPLMVTAGEMFRVTTLDLDNLPKTEDGKVDFSQDFFNNFFPF